MSSPRFSQDHEAYRKFTDEERMDVLLESPTASTVKHVIADHGIDKVTFYGWKKRVLGKDVQSMVDDVNRDELSA